MNDITPTGLLVGASKWIWFVIICGLLAGGLIVGLWQVGWLFSNADVNRQTQQIQNSDSSQRALVSDLTAKVGDVAAIKVQMDAASGQQYADLHAQRLGEAADACQDAEQVSVPLRQGLGAWVTSNCLAGSVSPGSSLRK